MQGKIHQLLEYAGQLTETVDVQHTDITAISENWPDLKNGLAHQTQLIAKPAARVEYQNDALTKLTEQVDHQNEAIDQLVPVELAVNEPVKSAALSYVSEPGAASVTGLPYSTQTPVPNTPPTFSRRRVVVKIRGFGENSAAARWRFLSARSSGHTNKAGSSSLRCEEPYLPQRGLSAL